MKGLNVRLCCLLLALLWGCGKNGEPPLEDQSARADVSRSVDNPLSAPGTGMPPTREDGYIVGRIIRYETHRGEALNIQPEDLIVYIYAVEVRRSSLPSLQTSDQVTLRSKLSPPADWEGQELSMQAAEFAGGASYWLTAFDLDA